MGRRSSSRLEHAPKIAIRQAAWEDAAISREFSSDIIQEPFRSLDCVLPSINDHSIRGSFHLHRERAILSFAALVITLSLLLQFVAWGGPPPQSSQFVSPITGTVGIEPGTAPAGLATAGVSRLSATANGAVDASWFCVRCSHSKTPIPPREYAGMTYDATDRYVVLFGGDEEISGVANDTWIFSAGVWTELATPIAPSPRMGAAMAYDPADGYVVLFGGWNTFNVLGDTWIFKSGTWTQRAPAVSPPARQYGSMAYDAADGFLLLFGGGSGVNATLSDTWSYKAGVWQNLSTAAAPRGRQDAAMTYDPTDGYMVLFGGTNSAGVYNDTWSFRGGMWTQLAPPASPAGRQGTGLAHNPEGGGLALLGGYDRLGGFGDTWLFGGGLWTPLVTVTSPSVRGAFAMTTDSADGYVLVMGGYLFATRSYGGDPWGLGAALKVVLSAIPQSLELGQSVTFAPTATGGAPPYVYYWSGLPAGCMPGQKSSVTCTPTTVGSFQVSVEVNDTAWIVNRTQLTLDVKPPLPYPAWLPFVGGISVLLIACATMVVFWLKRRRSSHPPRM